MSCRTSAVIAAFFICFAANGLRQNAAEYLLGRWAKGYLKTRARGKVTQKILERYRAWLTEPTEGKLPNIFVIFLFALIAIIWALLTGIPAFSALWHGASSQGSVQWGTPKDGRTNYEAIQPTANIDAVIIVVSVVLVLSSIALFCGWLDRFCE